MFFYSHTPNSAQQLFPKNPANDTRVCKSQNAIKHNIYYHALGEKNTIGGFEVKFRQIIIKY